MTDLHAWITQQVDEAEAYALDHILNPANALRRCEADRKILAIHAPAGSDWEPYGCNGCGIDSEYGYEVTHTNDCETLQALAYAYGLTEEQLATLDRPEPERPKPTGQSLVPDELVEAFTAGAVRHFLGTLPVEPRPEAKALKILEPELKKISTYVPVSKEQL